MCIRDRDYVVLLDPRGLKVARGVQMDVAAQRVERPDALGDAKVADAPVVPLHNQPQVFAPVRAQLGGLNAADVAVVQVLIQRNGSLGDVFNQGERRVGEDDVRVGARAEQSRPETGHRGRTPPRLSLIHI